MKCLPKKQIDWAARAKRKLREKRMKDWFEIVVGLIVLILCGLILGAIFGN